MRQEERRRGEVGVIDFKRAYLQAEVKRDIYVELPEEDKEVGTSARLHKAMYGTRDAAQSREVTYRGADKD